MYASTKPREPVAVNLREPPFKPDERPTKIQITHQCYVRGVLRAPGDELIVSRWEALDLLAAGRVDSVG